jgi:hypothetical protein
MAYFLRSAGHMKSGQGLEGSLSGMDTREQ